MVPRAVGAFLMILLVACGSAGPSPRALPGGGLLIHGAPSDATVFIDEKYLGTVASLGGRALELPEGTHRIEVRKEGYFAHYAEVTLARGVQQRLEVQLRKQPF